MASEEVSGPIGIARHVIAATAITIYHCQSPFCILAQSKYITGTSFDQLRQ